jgi:sugar O-acyltransferase (sialic acid O-acetyltransferase NeuD family)
MEKVIIGAGGFASEIRAHFNDFKMKCFVDDDYFIPNNDCIHSIDDFDPDLHIAIIAIGDPKLREEMVNKLPSNTKYFTYIHESVKILGDVNIGEGAMIAAGCILTTNIKIGKHTHLNLLSTIGHDCVIGDYFTTAPGSKISGNCNIGDRVYFGTNSSVRQKINICNDVTIGLNAGVVKNIIEHGTYVGVPAKRIK